MKITIEPTHEGISGDEPNATVSLSLPGDYWNLPEVMLNLIEPLLVAWGFSDVPKLLEKHYSES